MTIAPLISIAGAAGVALAGAAASALEGASFAQIFAQEAETSKPVVHPLESLPTTLADIEADGRAALERFQQAFASKLAELGISLGDSIQLSIDSFGKIRETSGHPQAQDIESLLADNSQMSHDFRKANAQLSTARAGREHAEFSRLYAQNPDLATQVYAHLFDDNREQPQISIRVDASGALPVFE